MADAATGPCWLTGDDPLMTAYHDEEWGRPVLGERELYERFVLEGFQSGLSWRTVLAKRPAFREVFAGFEPEAVAAFDESHIERLLLDARIIRHRRKIEAAITNARAVLALRDAGNSLPGMVWSYAKAAERTPAPGVLADLPATTPVSSELSKRPAKAGVCVRRADHGIRGDAGVRGRQRSPHELPGARGCRGGAPRRSCSAVKD